MSLDIKEILSQLLQKNLFIYTNFQMLIRKRYPIIPDYFPSAGYRYGYGKPPHAALYEIINEQRNTYVALLKEFLNYDTLLSRIPIYKTKEDEPFWTNTWFQSLDAIALYCFLCMYKPATFLEIGSGNSTKFIRRAIIDNNLGTKIISIDPQPRAKIDTLCDEVVRTPLEKTDIAIFKELEENDILFFDGSHRCWTNSDVTVFFLEILPGLPLGVLCHVHDIFLPYDYPPEWNDRLYSEQFVLAAYLLAKTEIFNIVLPNAFISRDPQLLSILKPLDRYMDTNNRDYYSNSFWIKTK